MEKTLLEKLQTNTKLRSYLGFSSSNTFTDKDMGVEGGIPDIISHHDDTLCEVSGIFEIKK